MEIATIVTGYFQLKFSKAPDEKYKEWMKNMLSIHNPMVIFCDEESEPIIREMRADKKEFTVIIVTKFDEFYSYRYINHFYENYRVDLERSVGHNPFLYMIWSEKTNFLRRAIELNPFRSDYFLWVDIGCFRKTNTEYLNWPNPEKIAKLDKSKVMLLSVVPFTPDELSTESLSNLPPFQFVNRIGATMFGGGKEALLKWHKLYYDMLEFFIMTNRFIGKDQSIMNCVYLLNRDMFHLVLWANECVDPIEYSNNNDPWFFIRDYLI